MSQNAIVKKVVHPGVVEVSLMRQMECGLSCSSCEGCPQRPKEEILALAENLHEFTVVPDISTTEEYGRYMIQESGHFEVDPSLEDYIDYQSYGERRVQEEGGLFGDRGYVAYLGTKPEMKEIMARNIPAERMEQGPQMGGLT